MIMLMNSVTVFCGSSEGYDPVHRETAYELGVKLAERKIRMVYGGAKVGLMGVVADAILENGGEVIGVIPEFLKTVEIAHEGLTELITVGTMHERKLKMNELCDGVITLPGGFGTLEEMFEMLTWGQLGLHSKPIGLLNINGYYDALAALCTNMVSEGFLSECNRTMLLTSPLVDELLEMMDSYVAPDTPKYITKQTT
ncbi:MAG: TIGR00730 family Rossman fold protein [Sphingobacteriales bacterium]|nr:MAG: TIGR00730 family Rossman fold protein [Sphingobacteriales bacterium]